MLGFLKAIFAGGGAVQAIEKVAMEAIDTPEEKAKASALWIKTLDPNGVMRRELARFASKAYGFYLVATSVLIFMHFFGLGDPEASQGAMEAMTNLFLPITTAWGSIVTASFGVNGINAYKGQ